MRATIVLIIFAVILTTPFLVGCYAFSGEIDATAVVSDVHDGDTFTLDRTVNGSDTVRLADIDAPELGQPVSSEAKDVLKLFLLGKTVYLDIDDIYVYDYQGTGTRLVCVVYVDYNSTHYVNVNEALLVAGFANVTEYDNEFNAETWTLFALKANVIPEFPVITTFVIAILALMAIITFLNKILGKNSIS